MEENRKTGNSILDKIVDFFFSNDNRKWLIPILIIAIILRVLVILHVAPLSDEMVHGAHAINIISSGVINEQNQCPVWFYLTDLSYRLFGVNAFAGRFLSFFFGILTIPLIYLISRKLFNEKIAVIAAFLLAISAYHIDHALMEMDQAMIFFILFSFYFFINAMNKKQISYISIILMAVAVLIKPIALTFIPAFAIYFIFTLYKQSSEDRKIFLKNNSSKLLVGGILFLLFMTPVLAYNYILYQQKGIVDILFARFFNINRDFFGGLQGTYKSFSVTEAITFGVPWAIKYAFFLFDPAISFLAVLGILLIFLNKRFKNGRFLILIHAIPIFFLMGSAQLQTHFVVFMPLFAITASSFISFVSEKFKERTNQKIFVVLILLIVLIINLFLLMPYITSKAGIFKLRDYAVSNIGEKDIVIVDSRTYRGQIAWAFNDKAYIEASYFSNLMALNQNISGIPIPTNLYFVECAIDDCGWGYIGQQPEFNESMEQMVGFFKNNSSQEKIIFGGGGRGEKVEEHFIIYKATIDIKPAIYKSIYETHDWFYYPVRWAKNDWYDKYSPQGTFQIVFNSLGKLFLWIAIIIAIFSPILLIVKFIKK